MNVAAGKINGVGHEGSMNVTSAARSLVQRVLPMSLRRRGFVSRARIQELESTPDIRGKQFLFIAGLHRSGTSILHRHLREHDVISGFHDSGAPEDEGQHLQDVLPTARDHGGPGRFAFDPRAHMVESDAEDLPERARERLLRQWGAQWDLSRAVLVEKSPPTLTRARFLQALFPNSSFVFLVRHPIVVSLATKRWARTPLNQLVRHWCHAHQLMIDDLPELNRATIVRYEDYVRDPASALATICTMIGIEPAAPRESVFDGNARYLDDWQKSGANDAAEVRRAFEEGRVGGQFGYLPDSPYVCDEWRLN